MIEDIITGYDRRGIALVRDALSPTYCTDAAEFLLSHRGPVLILTGFYVAGTAETDGPPGALALADALRRVGSTPSFVTDRYCAPLLQEAGIGQPEIDLFPITDARESAAVAAQIVRRREPALVVSVERCGATASGRYLNMRGVDITAHTARLDPLLRNLSSIAVGDGGNEIGMGTIAKALTTRLGIVEPCRTDANQLVIGAVSNWAVYGLLTSLSLLTGQDLLPPVHWEQDLLRRLIEAGAVDGVTGRSEPTVDGYPAAFHAEILTALHGFRRKHAG